MSGVKLESEGPLPVEMASVDDGKKTLSLRWGRNPRSSGFRGPLSAFVLLVFSSPRDAVGGEVAPVFSRLPASRLNTLGHSSIKVCIVGPDCSKMRFRRIR